MAKIQGGRGRVQNTDRPQPGVTQRAHPDPGGVASLLWETLCILEGFCEAGPDPRRVDLRDLRSRIAHRFGFVTNDSALAQDLEEMDGTPHDDAI